MRKDEGQGRERRIAQGYLLGAPCVNVGQADHEGVCCWLGGQVFHGGDEAVKGVPVQEVKEDHLG